MKTFKALEQAITFHDHITELKITGHLRDQLYRSVSSIALNLSEGNAKSSIKEKKRFYQTAYASLKESQTTLRLLKIQDPEIIDEANKLGGSLYKLMNSAYLSIHSEF